MAEKEETKIEKSSVLWSSIFIVIFIGVFWFLFFQDENDGFDFDEEKYIRNSLSEDYEVINISLEGTTIYAEI